MYRACSKLQRAHYEKYRGTERSVLWEAENVDGHMLGYTDNYLRVSMPHDAMRVNTISSVTLDRSDADGHLTALPNEKEQVAAAAGTH